MSNAIRRSFKSLDQRWKKSFKIVVAISNAIASTIYFHELMFWFKLVTLLFYVWYEISSLTYPGIYIISTYFQSGFSVLSIVQLHEKYSNSSEGKEYESKKLKWPEHLPKLFSGSGLQDCEFLVLYCYQDCLKMKTSWKKRVSGCNSVAAKTMKIRINLPLLEVKSFHHHPTYLLYMRVDYCGTYNGSKSKWHTACAFLFLV